MEKVLLSGCFKEGRLAKRGGRHFLDFTIADAYSDQPAFRLPFINCCFSGKDLYAKVLALKSGMKVNVTALGDPDWIRRRTEIDEIRISDLELLPC